MELSIYPIRCILPHDRYVSSSLSRVIALDEHNVERIEQYNSRSTIRLYDRRKVQTTGENEEEKEWKMISFQALADLFNFQYVPHLVFLHERDLREVFMNKPDEDEESHTFVLNSDQFGNSQLKEWLNNAYINPSMSIRHVGMINQVDVGYGVFAEDDLPSGAFLGEYVGVVHGTSGSTQFLNSMQQEVDKDFGDRLAYTCQYPSCDGGLGINAIEYGNVIRFMNHSSNPNAELRYYWGEGGLMHVLCFVRVERSISKGEQIMIDYGASYWSNKSAGKVLLDD